MEFGATKPQRPFDVEAAAAAETKHHDADGSLYFDYSKRALWLRAVVLGGCEGLVTTAFIVMGSSWTVETYDSSSPLLVTGFADLIAGAIRMAVAEFVSVYTQVDIVRSQNERDRIMMGAGGEIFGRAAPPSPSQIAVVASLSYVVGGIVPLVAAGIVRDRTLMFCLAALSATLCMLVVGHVGAALGKAPILRSCARTIIGAWIILGVMLGKRKILELIGIPISCTNKIPTCLKNK